MFYYYINIADISIEIESPVSIVFQEKILPFCRKKGNSPDLTYKILSGRVENGESVVSKAEYSIEKKDNRYIRVKKMFQCGQMQETFLLQEKPGIYHLYIPQDCMKEGHLFDRENVLDFLALEEGLLQNHAFILHASVVSWKGNGILFTAPSGTGKSTQAELWHRYHGADILNGDRAIIRRTDGTYRVYGSPYAGSSGIYRNQSAPVRAVIILEQSQENQISRCFGKEAFVPLFRETLMNSWSRNYMSAMTELIGNAAAEIPVYHLACRPDKEATDLVRKNLEKGA